MSKITIDQYGKHPVPVFFGVANYKNETSLYRWIAYSEFERPMARLTLAKDLGLRIAGYVITLRNIRKL
jgi:hypothetical protein